MNVLKCSFEELEEFLIQSKEIDEGISFLDSKLAHVKNLGLSLEPEKTKKEAENVLSAYAEELDDIKNHVMDYLASAESVLEDLKNDNEQVGSLMSATQTELEDFELMMRSVKDYEPYQSIDESMINPDVEEVLGKEKHQASGGSLKFNTTPSKSLLFSPTSKSENLLNTSMPSALLSPIDACYTPNRSACAEISNRSAADWHLNNSLALLEKKLRKTDEVMRTPVDPGISYQTMQLIGKSNFKTKVYRKIPTYDENDK